MLLWKTLRFLAALAVVGVGTTVAALAQGAVADEGVPAPAATPAARQQPASEPAPDGPAAAEPGESPSPKPGRPAPAARLAPQARPAGEARPAPTAPRGERVNVRVDLKIRAQNGSRPPVEKTLSLVTVGDNSRTAIRTKSSIPFRTAPTPALGIQYQTFSLNADAHALVDGRRITVTLTLDYEFANQAHEGEVEGRAAGTVTSSVQNMIQAVLEDGQPLVVSDQVDAATDYRVTVEAKATILR